MDQLFPNPTTGIIQITVPDNTEWKVSVRDAIGRMIIHSHTLIKREVDLSNIPVGLYFIELNNGRQTIAKRLVKQ